MTLAAPLEPAQIDTGMTLGDILLEMAVRYGTAVPQTASVSVLPSNRTEEYRVLLAAFNRGYGRFLRRREWTFIERSHQFLLYPAGDGPNNLDGDSARYRLPHWARGIPSGKWMYTDPTSGYSYISMRPVDEVRYQIARWNGPGTPTWAGIGPIVSRSGTGSRGTDWELVLWPRPGSAYHIRATFRLNGHRLTSLDQRHIAGAEHDEAILAEALWALYETDVQNPERDGVFQARNEAVADSIRIDTAMTLGNKGSLIDSSLQNSKLGKSGWGDPDLYVNGTKMEFGTGV